MARVFITGSSDGLSLMVAKLLVDEGHELALQGRNEARRKSGKVACDCVLGARRRAAATAATLTDIAMLLHGEDSWRRDAASFCGPQPAQRRTQLALDLCARPAQRAADHARRGGGAAGEVVNG
jgi:NAD(P)-dependent dehydrogenase (short-subunit alcohol dehydrogenase family)